jgi:hypothetical protein
MSAHEWGGDWSEPDEIIPACGVSPRRYDPRDSEIRLHRTYQNRRPELKEFPEEHRLEIHCFDGAWPSASELLYIAADFRRKHKDAWDMVLFVSPERFTADLDGENWLRKWKFERTLKYERAEDRSFAVTKKMKAVKI